MGLLKISKEYNKVYENSLYELYIGFYEKNNFLKK